MTLDSKKHLLDVLRRTQLLATEQVEQVATELLPFYPDATSIARYLVEIDWITAYQMGLLLSDRWDETAIGPYQILDRLGEGGISEVLKAWDTARGRVVALKVLRQDLTTNAEVVRQFRQEQQAITRLNHPNIIKTFDAGKVGPWHYFAMEYVEGMDLERFVRQVGPLPVELACDLGRQAAQGLQHAHGVGLVHRDVKPANLFLIHPPLSALKKGPDPVIKVIDWGLARFLHGEGDGGGPDGEKGRLMGTADYIAPEQIEDASLVDIRADIYSLGGVLFFLLTGQPPFRGGTLMQKIVQHRDAPPPSVRDVRPDVCEELDELLQRMLAKAPEQRPQIPLLLVAALRKFSAGQIGSAQATLLRPGSVAPGTALNLPRPQTHGTLTRPGTQPSMQRPANAR
ncbi:MAG: serine/threonine protein kinase [Gemmataceae bacterium]